MATAGGRHFIAASEPVPEHVLRAAFGSTVVSVVPCEKKDTPTCMRDVLAVRDVQQAAVSAALRMHDRHRPPRRAVVLAPRSVAFMATDLVVAAEESDGELTRDGHVFSGVLFSEAPEMPAVLQAQASQALNCLYDMAPLRPGLRIVCDGLASDTESAQAVRTIRAVLADAGVMIGERATIALTPELVADGLCCEKGYALLDALQTRCRAAVEACFGEAELHYSGAL